MSVLFEPRALNRVALAVGRNGYKRLHVAENLLRVAIHSILYVEIGPDWWGQAISPVLSGGAEGRRRNRLGNLRFGPPGPELLRYMFLSDLAEALRSNSHVLRRLMPDVDAWIQEIETMRISRNTVAHMNQPSSSEQRRIDQFHGDAVRLISALSRRIALRNP